jgi:hypothetical protein
MNKKTAMKTLTFLLSILAATLITTTVLASDKDSSRVEKKIVKTIMITDDGKVMIDSTFITENGKVTIHVDSIMRKFDGPDHWSSFRHKKGNCKMYGNSEEGDEYEVTVEMDGDSTHSMVIKNPKCKHRMDFEGDNVIMNKKMILHDIDGMPCPPSPPAPPKPGCFSNQRGMIDLNDPSIISYEKKTQKDGTEKITIIRKMQ